MKISGKVIVKGDRKNVGSKYVFQDLVIETEDKYPQKILLQASNDKVELVQNLNLGDMVEVDFFLNGREWQGKYFNTLSIWSIALKSAATQPVTNNESDLPF
jgi:single-strand DNA-binding protein